ncbi:hypothetical protein Chor_000217, partial [Crotalus horridus]
IKMMKNVHLAPEADEDDLYSGYNDYNPTFDTEDLENDPAFQQAVKTSHGRRPPLTAKVPGTSSARTLATGYVVSFKDNLVFINGQTNDSSYAGSAFDPLGQARGPAPPLETKNEDSPEGKIKQLEKKVNELVEESCIAHSCGDLKLALEKAKDAGRKERALVRQREQTMSPANINLDLTYTVSMLKVNMANIYLKQRNYSKAIKFYRMALDQIASVHKEMRIKIMQNIGVAFIKTGQYTDAISSFEHIMNTSPNLKAGFNLILCYFATGDRDQMKKAFQKLLAVPLEIDDDDKYISQGDDPHTNLLIEAIKNDSLRQMEREKKATAEKYIMTAAKLIAPAIETSFAVGYDWCVEMVKTSQYVELANDLEINKAITYLRQKDFNQAVDTLKMFEKKDSRVKSAAATNLSFLYFLITVQSSTKGNINWLMDSQRKKAMKRTMGQLQTNSEEPGVEILLENEIIQASNYADLAVNSDRYNPAALTNKGNTIFINGDYEKAAEFYKESLRNDSSCTEALYNIGLSYKKLNRLDEALDSFLKLHAILRNSAQVLFQIASIYELMEDPNQAIEWLMQLISVVPTDSHALAKLGELYDSEGDKSQAFQYYYESYRYFPSNIEVIEWLGAYYIDTQFCEKAIHYFERAALIQPTQVKWQLMVASCYRRSGLRFLVRLCTDMGMKEVQEYATKLKRVEKLKELREQRVRSGRNGSARARREGSAGGEPGSTTIKGERLSTKLKSLPGTNEPYESNVNKEIEPKTDIKETSLAYLGRNINLDIPAMTLRYPEVMANAMPIQVETLK